MHSCDKLFLHSREGYFGVYLNTKIALEWAQKQLVTRVYTLFYFLHDITNAEIMIKNDDLYTSPPCLTHSVFVLLMTSQSIADDVTMTSQLRRDHVNSDV